MAKYTETDIWKDPRVVDALKDGRSADDIMILDCPKCGAVIRPVRPSGEAP